LGEGRRGKRRVSPILGTLLKVFVIDESTKKGVPIRDGETRSKALGGGVTLGGNEKNLIKGEGNVAPKMHLGSPAEKGKQKGGCRSGPVAIKRRAFFFSGKKKVATGDRKIKGVASHTLGHFESAPRIFPRTEGGVLCRPGVFRPYPRLRVSAKRKKGKGGGGALVKERNTIKGARPPSKNNREKNQNRKKTEPRDFKKRKKDLMVKFQEKSETLLFAFSAKNHFEERKKERGGKGGPAGRKIDPLLQINQGGRCDSDLSLDPKNA